MIFSPLFIYPNQLLEYHRGQYGEFLLSFPLAVDGGWGLYVLGFFSFVVEKIPNLFFIKKPLLLQKRIFNSPQMVDCLVPPRRPKSIFSEISDGFGGTSFLGILPFSKINL